MLLIRSRAVLAGVVCAVSVAMVGVSIVEATTAPPDDTSTDTSESSTPPGSDGAAAETTGADTGAATAVEAGGMEILPPDEMWAGATRGEWDARFWQWAVSFPEEGNPNFDTTGESCGYGQSGPVFFLPASFTGEPAEPGFTCVVAEGTAIYGGLIGAECSTVEPPPFFGRDEDELRACAIASMDEVIDFPEVTINGEDLDLGDLEAYHTSSPLFTLTFPENNFFGVEPGVAHAVSDGYGFLIAPPPPGEYVLAISIAGPEPYASSITVVVEAPQVIEPPVSTAPGSTEPVETSSPSSDTTEAADTTLPATSEATETTSVATETTSPA